MKKLFVITLIAVFMLSACDAMQSAAPQATTALPASATPIPAPTLALPALDPVTVHTQSPEPSDPQTQAIQVQQPAQTQTAQQATQAESQEPNTCNTSAALSDQDAVRYLIYCFDSAWIDYVNNNSKRVYDYIVADGPAQKIVGEFNTSGVTERFEKLEVYGVYIDGGDAYAAVYEKINKTSNGTSAKKYNWLYRAKKQNGAWKIYSFSQNLPASLMDKLSSLVASKKYGEAKALADVISSIWVVNEQSSFNSGDAAKDLAVASISESIDRYDAIDKLSPQDGADTHKKDSWRLDIAALYVLMEDYASANLIYDAIIAANDCNVTGACIGKAEIFRRQGDDANMKLWFVKAASAAENGDMLP